MSIESEAAGRLGDGTAHTVDDASRDRVIAEISEGLPRVNGQLWRLLFRCARVSLPRGMASILAALGDRPQSITELADREGLAQPSVTQIVKRLETLGFVRRERDPDDGRVVEITITEQGHAEFLGMRAAYSRVLHEQLAAMSDTELAALLNALDALRPLVEGLRDGRH